MYLSSLLVEVGTNPDRPRPGRAWLRNLYHVHQRLCMAFPSAECKTADPHFLRPYTPDAFPEDHHLAEIASSTVGSEVLRHVHAKRGKNSGFLFRVDAQPGASVVVLVQSALLPDWDYAFQNATFLLAARPEVRTIDPSFAAGQLLRFRLTANPTKKVDTKSGPDGVRRNGKRVPVPVEEFPRWLARRATPGGFALEAESLAMQAGYVYWKKPRQEKGQQLRSVRYDGLLRVLDPDRFRETLTCGIGPAKAFGFGLLSVARAE